MVFSALAKLVVDPKFQLRPKDNSLTPIIEFQHEMIDGDDGYKNNMMLPIPVVIPPTPVVPIILSGVLDEPSNLITSTNQSGKDAPNEDKKLSQNSDS